MPLSINVGLSRKASKDYQSTGVSINVTAELDQSLLAKPNELQAQIDALYSQAESAIARQVKACAGETAPQTPARTNGTGQTFRRNGGTGATSRDQHSNGNGRNGSGGSGMTASQKRAIEAIADRLNINAADEIHHEFGWAFDRLSVREASKVIDHLKSLQPSGNGSNGSGNGSNGSGR
jgi:hypothetical protein